MISYSTNTFVYIVHIRYENMKYILTFILIFLCYIIINAQERDIIGINSNKTLKNEIGINLFNITYLRQESWRDNTLTYDCYFANGVIYKRKIKQFFLRSLSEYKYSKFDEHKNNIFAIINDKGTNITIGQAIGCEKRLFKTKIKPFVATDIIFSYTQIKGTYFFKGGDLYYEEYQDTYTTNIITNGLSFTIGLTYNIYKRFSIVIESNVDLAYSFSKKRTETYNYENNIISNKIKKDIYCTPYINPLSVFSINYHFN